MKWVLYSDIHAQIPQLDAVQEAIKKENADREIIIGDLIHLGPQPSEVIERFAPVRKAVGTEQHYRQGL